jgi:hypothetical protein
MAYLLDANVFIEGKNRYYGFDFCPGFWDWLDAANAAHRVFSIEKVGDELAAIADDLSAWAAGRGARLFLPVDAAMLGSLRQVTTWAQGQRYEPGAVTTFLQDADSYLVAQALALGLTVVTQEVPSASLKRIKVPDACVGLGVRCVSPFEMLRNERARFVLGATA